jgi:hypothetical protein
MVLFSGWVSGRLTATEPVCFLMAGLVRLNVGGRLFCTSAATLAPSSASFFSALLSGRMTSLMDETGVSCFVCSPRIRFCLFRILSPTPSYRTALRSAHSCKAYFIDRDPDLFAIVLNYLRTNKVMLGSVSVSMLRSVPRSRLCAALVALIMVSRGRFFY